MDHSGETVSQFSTRKDIDNLYARNEVQAEVNKNLSGQIGDRQNVDNSIIAELRGFRELCELKFDNLEKTTSRIETQTIKTNGRVTTLELVNAEAKGKAKISGILWASVSSIVISVVAYFINNKGA